MGFIAFGVNYLHKTIGTLVASIFQLFWEKKSVQSAAGDWALWKGWAWFLVFSFKNFS